MDSQGWEIRVIDSSKLRVFGKDSVAVLRDYLLDLRRPQAASGGPACAPGVRSCPRGCSVCTIGLGSSLGRPGPVLGRAGEELGVFAPPCLSVSAAASRPPPGDSLGRWPLGAAASPTALAAAARPRGAA